MNQRAKVIGVLINEQPTWHVTSVGPGDYATLCGLDGSDDHPDVGQSGTISPKRGQKIDCQQCRDIWSGVIELKLRRSNFA